MEQDELTTKERMRRLRRKEPIDRVPVHPFASLYAARLCGYTYMQFYTEPEKAFRAKELAGELHGYDDSPSYLYGWPDWAGYEFGGEVAFPDNGYAFPVVNRRPLEKVSDIESFQLPEPEEGPVMKRKLECARRNVDRGGKAVIQTGLSGLVGSIIGNDTMLRWYFKEPEAVHTLFRKVADYIHKVIDYYFSEFGIENCGVSQGFPLDSHNVISPDTFERFSFVYLKELNTRLVTAGVKSWQVHLCGDHTNNLPCWKEIPLPQRTVISIGSEMDILKTAESFGPDHIISGNVPTATLQLGTPEEVMEMSKTIIEQVKDFPGGFVLRPACGLPALTPPVNVHAMVKAVRTYGRYR